MQETAEHIIVNLLAQQRVFFATHQTKDIDFRLNQLRKLKKLVLQYEQKIADALWLDLHKSPEEAYLTETSIVLSEIDNHLKQLEQWAKPKAVATPIHLFPSSSKIIYEPLGIALIVAPWNYPFQLLFNPLIGAISAGCCSLLKPSPDAPNIAKVMQEMIAEAFDPKHICLVQGGRETNSILFAQRFNLIFFTGSPKVGKVVMRAAAEHLTPVILELGGKSPCVVDADADLDVAAKRIAWGKLLNAGQTCIAPDYLFAHSTIKDILLDKIAQHMKLMYGEDSKQSRFYPRIINHRAMDRLTELLSHGKIHTGGTFDRQEKYISPTIIDYVSPDFLLMQEEIFGPILPVMTFEHLDQAIDYINTNEKPLALYYFGKNKNAAEVLTKTSSGGACINDVILQVGNHHLPFGGVGNSGMGSYHGQESFLVFSHRRAVLTTPTWMDIPFKYVPFKYFKLLKKFI